MRIADAVGTSRERLAIPVLGVFGAGAVILALPSLGAQIAAIGLAAVALAGLLFAGAGRTLNAVWVAVLGIFLIDPLSVTAATLQFPISIVLIIAALPVPFVALGLWQDPAARARIRRIAPLLALGALAGLSIAWSADPGYGVRKLGLWALTGLLPAAAILVLASPARPLSWRSLLVVATAYSVVLLVIGTTSVYPGRLTFFDGNPIWMARAVYLGAIVAVFAPLPTIVRVAVLVPLLVAGYRTDSLGPTIGLVLGLGAGAVEAIRIAPGGSGRAFLRLAAVGVVVAAGVAVALAVVADEPQRLSPLIVDPNVSSRAQYLQAAAGMFQSAPLLGAGLGAFATLGLADIYPHNLFAEVAAELGLAGLALLVAWLVLALRSAAGSPLLVALVVAGLVFALFSGNIAGNTELWAFSALAVAMARRRTSDAPATATTGQPTPGSAGAATP